MPGTICSVAVCRSNFVNAKKRGEKIVFFSFPKDPIIRREWIKRCYRSDDFHPENKRVCNKHFTEDDYTDVIQARLMGTIPRRLKATAIPTLNLLPPNTRTVDFEARRIKRLRKKLAVDRIPPSESIPHSSESANSDNRNLDPTHELQTIQPKQENQMVRQTIPPSESIPHSSEHANLDNQKLGPTHRLQMIQPKQENQVDGQTIFAPKSIFPSEKDLTNLCSPSSGKNSDYDALQCSYDALLKENAVLRSQIEVHIRKEVILQQKIDELENSKSLSNIIVLIR